MRGYRARTLLRRHQPFPRPSSLIPASPPCFSIIPVARRHCAAAFALDVVLLDLFVQVRARGIDGLGGLGDVPAVLAELGEDERLLRFVLAILERGEAHGGSL